jgi:AcrR family transcriptional regulator
MVSVLTDRTIVLNYYYTNDRANVKIPVSRVTVHTQSSAFETTDGRRLRGDRTKRAILAKAVDQASAEGLEGLSIGRLASELEVSKSGLFAHFGSKEELQLETINAASELFEEHVWLPVADVEPGLVRLAALMDSWLRYFRTVPLSGGCFFSNAYHEFDSRSGPVHDRIADQKQRWMATIAAHVRSAQKRRQLRADVDAEQLAFELDALGGQANSLWQLNGDERAFEWAATGIRTRLGDAATPSGRRALAEPQAATWLS